MPTKRAATQPDGRERWPTFTDDDDGALRAVWPEHRVRYLLSDGRTVDVVTTHDSSDLRGALLAHLSVDRIEGSTSV